VISRSSVVISTTNCYIRFTLLYFTHSHYSKNSACNLEWSSAPRYLDLWPFDYKI